METALREEDGYSIFGFAKTQGSENGEKETEGVLSVRYFVGFFFFFCYFFRFFQFLWFFNFGFFFFFFFCYILV
jgi:hypothetical protein